MKIPEYIIVIIVLAFPFLSFAEFTFDRGEPDDGRHPNVGWIAAFDTNGYRLPGYCSGTLIASRVFLTASHCTIPIYDQRVNDPEYEGFQVKVGFTDDFLKVGAHLSSLSDTSLVFDAAQVHTNPDYDYYWMSPLPAHADIAVVILEDPPGLGVASLPYEGQLGDLLVSGELQILVFPAVGYGATDVIIPPQYNGAPWDWFETGQYRYVGYSSFYALHPGYMILSMNFNTGDSGPCYGDSGGPLFLGNSDIIAGITVAGDSMCRAMTAPLRLDTIGARTFIGQFADEYSIMMP